MTLAQLHRAASKINPAFQLIETHVYEFENAVWRLSLRFEQVPAAELLIELRCFIPWSVAALSVHRRESVSVHVCSWNLANFNQTTIVLSHATFRSWHRSVFSPRNFIKKAWLTSVAGALHCNGVPVICLPENLKCWIKERLRVQANTALDGTH